MVHFRRKLLLGKDLPRASPFFAIFRGLYEGARRPAPPHLEADIQKVGSDGEMAALIHRAYQDVYQSEALRGRQPLLVCCKAITRSLDAYSDVVVGEEQRRVLGLQQEGTGVGLEIREHGGQGPLVVQTVHPGGPAQRAGLRPGDEITRLDGQGVQELSDQQVFLMLTQGPMQSLDLDQPPLPSRPLTIVWRRPGGRERTTTLARDLFRVETVLGVKRRDDDSWDYLVDNPKRIAHIRIASLGRGCGGDLAEVLDRLHHEGLGGLVLDLRWCPGGFLDEAVEVARLFLDEGTIATVRSREQEDQVYRGGSAGKYQDFPLVVLVNGDTSGGAELIAAALQDHHRAVVAGQRTLGKGSVQTAMHLLGMAGVGLKLTSGTFLRPSGKSLHRFAESTAADDWGVRPDAGLDFRLSPDLSRQLRQWWLLQTLRPASSVERLPLDDPRADPQRLAALEALAGEMSRRVRAKP